MLYRFLKVGGSEGSGELKKNSWKNVDIKIQKLEVVRVVDNWKQNNLTNIYLFYKVRGCGQRG